MIPPVFVMLSPLSNALSDVRNSSIFTHEYSYGAAEFLGFVSSSWDTLEWRHSQMSLSGDLLEYMAETRAEGWKIFIYRKCRTFISALLYFYLSVLSLDTHVTRLGRLIASRWARRDIEC